MSNRKTVLHVLLVALLMGAPLVIAAKKGFSLRPPIRIDKDDQTIPQPKETGSLGHLCCSVQLLGASPQPRGDFQEERAFFECQCVGRSAGLELVHEPYRCEDDDVRRNRGEP